MSSVIPCAGWYKTTPLKISAALLYRFGKPVIVHGDASGDEV
jgi:hypothetical protein